MTPPCLKKKLKKIVIENISLVNFNVYNSEAITIMLIENEHHYIMSYYSAFTRKWHVSGGFVKASFIEESSFSVRHIP